MNILVVNHYAGSRRHGMEYRPNYLARQWVELGHRVSIVAASRSHIRQVQPTVTGAVAEEMIDGIRYVWLRTPPYEGNGGRRIWNMLTFVGRLGRHGARLVRDSPPDVVVASSTYPLDIFPAARIAGRCGARLIFEVHDLWPLSPVELAGMSTWHPFIMLMQAAENYAYRRADRVVSMLPEAREHMLRHGMSPEKFVYVPNGIEIAEWEGERGELPPEHLDALGRLGREGRFLVGYAGAHGVANALDTLVDAADLLHDQPIAFVLVGQGPEKEGLQRRAARLGLGNVVFLPAVPKPSVPALLERMDALFIGLKRSPLFRFGISPNKLMDYMMAGKPVIQAIEAGNDMVIESGCGLSVAPEDGRAVADAASRLMRAGADERRALGSRGREYVLARHDYRVLARRFLEIMDEPPADRDPPGDVSVDVATTPAPTAAGGAVS